MKFSHVMRPFKKLSIRSDFRATMIKCYIELNVHVSGRKSLAILSWGEKPKNWP